MYGIINKHKGEVTVKQALNILNQVQKDTDCPKYWTIGMVELAG